MAQSTTWSIKSIATSGDGLVLSQIVPWGDGVAVPAASISCTYPPIEGDIEALLSEGGGFCHWGAEDVRKPGFAIIFTFSEPVELRGFRFAGPSTEHWPVQHSVFVDLDAVSLAAVQWLGIDLLSPAPSYPLDFSKLPGAWTHLTAAGTAGFDAVACSADGRVILVVDYNNIPKLSTNGGVSWSNTTLGAQYWTGCAVSDDGFVLYAVVYGGYVYQSTDGGVTWVSLTALGSRAWNAVCCSSDGSKILAVGYQVAVLSSDYGVTGSVIAGLLHTFSGCAMTPDGRVMFASAQGVLYRSINGGGTWSAALSSINLYKCAVSNDGNTVITAVGGYTGPCMLSKDGGNTWVEVATLGNQNYYGVAVASDGTTLLVAAVTGMLWVSKDRGVTWRAQTEAGAKRWWNCCAARSGPTVFAVVDSGSGVAGLYSAQIVDDPAYVAGPNPVVLTGGLSVSGGSELQQGSLRTTVGARHAIDVENGGVSCIYGTVELYAQTGNVPLPRRVRLHRSRDGLLVRETWSDAQGNYRFDGITDRYKYDVIAWDHEGLQQSVVANDLTPEIMQ